MTQPERCENMGEGERKGGRTMNTNEMKVSPVTLPPNQMTSPYACKLNWGGGARWTAECTHDKDDC